MVSSEGACAAYYLYRRMNTPAAQGSRIPQVSQEEMNPVG
jgi:hydrogenase expression/formation protein HypD